MKEKRKPKGQWTVPDGFISQSTAAERLGVAPQNVAAWADRDKLPEPTLYGKVCRIYPAAIIEAMRQRREAGEPTPPGWWRTVDITTTSTTPGRRETFAERTKSRAADRQSRGLTGCTPVDE